ncbi:MAG: hypothetical protein ABII79_06885 [bacterium]
MKRLQFGAALMMVVFAFTCFFSAPVMSDDELPWDADDGGNGENVGDDTTVVNPGDEKETSYNPPSGWESPWWLNLFLKFVNFSSDVIIADGANVQTISSGSDFDRGEAVSATGEKMNTKAEHTGSIR